MAMLEMLGQAVWDVFGSMIAVAVLCYAAWNAFKFVHHPEFAAPVLLGAVGLVVATSMTSQFTKMMIVYLMLAAFVLWPAGRAWHKYQEKRRR